MIQSFRNSLPRLSLQTFSMRQVQDKRAALTPLQQRNLITRSIGILVIGLTVFTAVYQLARYCFTVKKPEPTLKLIFEEGVCLTGQNRRQGRGTKEYPDTFKIKKDTGDFTDSALIQGIREFYNGDVYEGKFENGELVEGTMTFANGAVWTGHFKGGKLYGKGKQDLSKYTDQENKILTREGYFVENLLHGQGTRTYKNGEVRKGEFDKGHLVEGKIITSPLDGRIFTGKFHENSYLHGQGRIDYPESSKLLFEEGEFKDDELQQGRKEFRNGEVHTGTFDKGKLIQGTMTDQDGRILKEFESL